MPLNLGVQAATAHVAVHVMEQSGHPMLLDRGQRALVDTCCAVVLAHVDPRSANPVRRPPPTPSRDHQP